MLFPFSDMAHIIGAVAQVIAYILTAPAPPFPVFILGFAINGFGVALQVCIAPMHPPSELTSRRMQVPTASWPV